MRCAAPVRASSLLGVSCTYLSANLAQLGTLAAPILRPASPDRPAGAVPPIAVLGQRYGMPEAVLVKPGGPVREPLSTAGKPDKIIVLFRHAVRATLIPELAHVLDTQAGFNAFDAAALQAVLPQVSSFDETFDLEPLILLSQRYGAAAVAIAPIVFTEDFAATNFPSVDLGIRHLAMIEHVVQLYDRLIAPGRPATGEAAALLELVRGLDLHSYVRLIEGLRAEDAGNEELFDRRWPGGAPPRAARRLSPRQRQPAHEPTPPARQPVCGAPLVANTRTARSTTNNDHS